MKEKITHKEKLTFYKDYLANKTENKLTSIRERTFTIGFLSLKIGFISAICGGFIVPWLFLLSVPAILVPFIAITIGNRKLNKIIKSLNPKLTYKDFKKMQESGEWVHIGYELGFETMEENHYIKDKSYIAEKPKTKIKNTTRSLNFFISKYEDATEKSEKLVKKRTNEIKKQKQENVAKVHVCSFSENNLKDIKFTYSLLNIFCNKFNCSLVEFNKSINFEKTDEHYLIMKDAKNRKYEFVFTKTYFVGLNECSETDLTAEWREYLNEKQQKIEKNM